MKKGLIYKITNNINGKFYIGKTETDLDIRIKGHINSRQKIGIGGAIKKYGIENFKWEVIEECSKYDLNEKEIYYIKKLKSNHNDIGYNLTLGGDGISGWKHNKEAKNKISERSKELWKNPEYRKKIHNEEINKKISETLTGTKFSKERKINHRNSVMKFSKTEEFKEKHKQIMINRYKKPIERQKQSERLSKKWILIDPDGKIYKIKNINNFCKENFENYKGFLNGFYRVSKGIQRSYKNWKCENCN